MNLEKLTNEELLKNYQRLAKRSKKYLTEEDAKDKEKMRKRINPRILDNYSLILSFS